MARERFAAEGHEDVGPIVPRWLLARPELSMTEKVLWSYIRDWSRFYHDNGEGEFRQSRVRIGRSLGISEESVKRALSGLVAAGFLSRTSRPGKPSLLRLIRREIDSPSLQILLEKAATCGESEPFQKQPGSNSPDYPGQNRPTTRATLTRERTRVNEREEANVRTTAAAAAPQSSKEDTPTERANTLLRCWKRMYADVNHDLSLKNEPPLIPAPASFYVADTLAREVADALAYFPTDDLLVAEMRRVARCFEDKDLHITFKGVCGQLGQVFRGCRHPDPVIWDASQNAREGPSQPRGEAHGGPADTRVAELTQRVLERLP